MFRFRPWLLCVVMLCLALSSKLGATPPLAAISDTLFNADGTFFNGVVVISWPSFEASDTSNVAAGTQNISVNNGSLYVQLIPTTNADTAAVYTVQYTSFGVTQFSEAWAVPPASILPYRVRDVRLAAGSVSGSAPAAATIITIADVTGLQSALNVRPAAGTAFTISRSAVIDATGAIDGAVGNLGIVCTWTGPRGHAPASPPHLSTAKFPPEPSTAPIPYSLWRMCRIHPPAWPCFVTGCC